MNTLMANINAATSFTAFEGYKFEQLGGKPVDPSAWTEYIKMACSNMPETILWGVTSGKLTGSETNIKIYYDDIKSIQRSILLPRIESMLKELQEYGLLPKGEFRIEFPPLFEESEKERAQYEFMRARAAQALAGDLNHPPILTLKEIRETLYPELPEIPEGLKEIWEKQYGFSVERQENKRLIINKLDDIERKKLLEKWLFPADKWEHAVYATALPLAYKLEDKFIKFLDKYYPIREVATESAVTKITSATNATVPVEVQEKFLKRLFGITVDHTKMKEKILPALQQTFDESADFTLEALDVPVYSLRDPDVDKWIELRAETHTWKFYENCAEKAKYAIIEGLKNGESIQAVKKRLGEIFEDKSNKDLMTLARTLTQEVVNEARMLAYQDNGIDRVIFIATLDERTCDECMNYDGKVFPVTDMPLVPVHPGCRCTWIPETVRPGGW
ncbi:MAG: hypothetical protein DRN20_06765 [Thermoplasmata archaeon]|nr:MAG: hypothetical protein DRN20_06765 [Thermoplasmata archaeon]